MNRTLLNIIIDLIAAVLMLGMIVTGYLLRFPLPPGSNKSLILWGLSRHQWGDVHFWISLSLLVVMLVHLVLHWNWVVSMVCKYCGFDKSVQPSLLKSGIWTAVVLGTVCVAFAWVAESQVRQRTVSACTGSADSGLYAGTSTENCSAEPSLKIDAAVSWNDVYPILADRCVDCHGVQRQLAGVRVDRRDDFFNSTSPLILPGQSRASALIEIVSGGRPQMAMADKHKLPDADIALLKAWIDQGAK